MTDSCEDYAVRLFLKKYRLINKESGYGEVIITVQDGKAVYSSVKIGEQAKMEMDKGG